MATTKSQKTSKRRGSRQAYGTSERRPGSTKLPQSDPHKKPFTPESLDRTVIAIPLLDILNAEEARRKRNKRLRPEVHPVIIDLNLEFPGGREAARAWVIKATQAIIGPVKRTARRNGRESTSPRASTASNICSPVWKAA